MLICKGHFSVTHLSLLSFVSASVCVCIVTIIYNKLWAKTHIFRSCTAPDLDAEPQADLYAKFFAAERSCTIGTIVPSVDPLLLAVHPT